MKTNLLLSVVLLFSIASCDKEGSTPVSASGATQADPIKVKKNSKGNTVEQQNIQDRISVTTNPTKVLWIHLIALDGKIVQRMAVKNKVTSSGKRLEPRSVVVDPNQSSGDFPSVDGFRTNERLQPDGSYGSSDPYIYWFDPQGRYHQWGTAGGLGYLLTDYPIDLADPIDSVTGMYNASSAAAEWQKQQEARLSGRPAPQTTTEAQ